jgi:putative addiction module antidote
MKLELKRIGNSTGLILPKELLARLGLEQGDAVFVTEDTERSFNVSPYDAHHEKVMTIARQVMKDYQNTFKALAK